MEIFKIDILGLFKWDRAVQLVDEPACGDIRDSAAAA